MNFGRELFVAGLIMSFTAGVPTTADGEDDWRLGLLESEGITGEATELEQVAAGYAALEAELNRALADLGSEDFKTRELAQAAILQAEEAALAWMAGLPMQDDPEMRMRLADIREELENRGPRSKEKMLRYAVESLVAERNGDPKDQTTRLVIPEWFNQEEDPLEGSYGRFEFHADEGMTGKVTNGQLRFVGDRDGKGSQSAILTPGSDGELPRSFRVSCMLGASGDLGSGSWNLGVSIGQARVLYHPGTEGGEFRVESMKYKRIQPNNKSMGFSPDPSSLQRMEIAVRIRDNGDMELLTVIGSGDGKNVFRDEVVLPAKSVGAVDRIGLWRNGDRGADAIFDDFVLDLREH